MWFLYIIGAILLIFIVIILVLRHKINKFMKEREPDEKRYEGGEKKALIIFHPTLHQTAIEFADQIAKGLQERGYDVTVNFASSKLTYDWNDFDLFVFGTGAYMNMGGVPIRRYLRHTPIKRRQIVLFSVGMNLKADPEIEQMKAELAHGNIIYQIKVCKGQEDVMEDFVTRLELDDPDFDAIPEEEPEEDFDEDDEEYDEDQDSADDEENND